MLLSGFQPGFSMRLGVNDLGLADDPSRALALQTQPSGYVPRLRALAPIGRPLAVGQRDHGPLAHLGLIEPLLRQRLASSQACILGDLTDAQMIVAEDFEPALLLDPV